MPSPERFSAGLAMLSDALEKGDTVRFSASLAADEIGGYSEDEQAVLIGFFDSLSLEGALTCLADGGWMRVAMLAGGAEVFTAWQRTQEDRTALRVEGDWFWADEATTARLGLGELGEAFRTFDYAGLAKGELPYAGFAIAAGDRLWALASPYSEDNGRLTASSGATGHGLTYTLDTDAARTVLAQWLDEAALPEALSARLRGLAETLEVTTPIKLNMVFVEGDLLKSAKLSGAIRVNGKRTSISYSYSCTVGRTSISHTYRLVFEPDFSDTMNLTASYKTSCSGAGRGARNVSISASGRYDGLPYRIKFASETVNRYAQQEDDALEEKLTGKVTGSLRYDGVMLWDASLKRDGVALVTNAGMTLEETYSGKIKTDGELALSGALRYTASVGENEEPPSVAEAIDVDLSNSRDVGGLRLALRTALEQAKWRLFGALPEPVAQTLLTLY